MLVGTSQRPTQSREPNRRAAPRSGIRLSGPRELGRNTTDSPALVIDSTTRTGQWPAWSTRPRDTNPRAAITVVPLRQEVVPVRGRDLSTAELGGDLKLRPMTETGRLRSDLLRTVRAVIQLEYPAQTTELTLRERQVQLRTGSLQARHSRPRRNTRQLWHSSTPAPFPRVRARPLVGTQRQHVLRADGRTLTRGTQPAEDTRLLPRPTREEATRHRQQTPRKHLLLRRGTPGDACSRAPWPLGRGRTRALTRQPTHEEPGHRQLRPARKQGDSSLTSRGRPARFKKPPEYRPST